MKVKGTVIAGIFIITGFTVLLSHLFINQVEYLYLLVTYAFVFILTGLTIFVKLTANAYGVQSLEGGFEELKKETHFYILEFAKVVSVLALAFYYPFETFILFVILDCLDGFSIPYRTRSLLLRHRIDKLTDFLCQIPFFIVALQLWPSLAVIFSIAFVFVVIKTVVFLTTGKRDALLFIPNFFFFLFFVTAVVFQFFPIYFGDLFGSVYNQIIVIAVILLVSTAYEVIYNGILGFLRYYPRRRLYG